ncbi:ESF1 homolog isoform X2 [Mangifera indica]|uniref:ESF1 homolog isoform X2 n=1 Tax=Mangifera indica TaxID=29780 RepID=UPI001CFB1248|nr:ESF1 homolog isoform X2 [Mangifera indica]
MKSKIEQDDDPDQNKKMFQHSLKQQSKAEIHPPLKRLLTETNFASSSTPVEKRDRPEKKHRNSENYPRHDCKTEGEYEKEGTGKKSESDQESELKETGYVASRSESEDDDDFNDSTYDDDEEEQDIEGSEDEEDVVELGMLPNRLAIVEMDWRSFKAGDLFGILSSYLPKDGRILSVAVHPTEFGIQCMKAEKVCGPFGLVDGERKNSDGEAVELTNEEKLHAYNKSTLRYNYAVVECDCSTTANLLYKACYGLEFEGSAIKLILKFIPDNMEFQYPPLDVATEVPANYRGLDFYTKAPQEDRNLDLSLDDKSPIQAKNFSRKFIADQLAELDPTNPLLKSLVCCRSATYALQVSQRQQNVDQREPVANGVNISDINPSKIEKYDFSSILRVLQMKSKQFEIICKYFN